ncbi:MAG TPA: 3-hydroxyacyl-CoA dehydrogenase family protein [Pyrinomonadaceae bacterium]|nr:3-hydroxyacyl-CoA dehydrogenase family protein [Pyrinomonadaceae bacterium]
MSTNSDGNKHNQTSTHSVEMIAVLGAGTMGHGIAQVAAAVRGRAGNSRSKTESFARVGSAAGSRLHFRDQHFVAFDYGNRFCVQPAGECVGMHFFNPVHIMRLVEIVTGAQTSEDATATVREVATRMKKEPITVRDVPEFASSRLGVTLGLEAMRMLEQGVASARDIDTAMELGYNHPMGPLRLTDLVGLDVRLNIAEYLHGKLGSETFRPPEILRRMVSEGKLGKKSGEGFYKWNEPEQAQRAYTT